MNGILKGAALILTACAAAMMLLFPSEFLDAGRGAAALCLNVAVPSLFPFFVLCGLFIALGGARLLSRLLSPVMRPLFNLPGAGALCFILGIISGYPMGAVCAAELYAGGECGKNEAERMLAFCNNSGPVFILGAVGAGMLSSPSAGRLLLLTHTASAFLTGLLFRFYNPKTRVLVRPQLPPARGGAKGFAQALSESVGNAVSSILKVCAFVILFSALSAALPGTPASPYIHALLEITGGIAEISALPLDTRLKLPIIAMLLAFSGVSVLSQVSAVISPVGLSIKPYILGKLLQGAAAFFLTAAAVALFPQSAEAFAQSAPPFSAQPLGKQLFVSLSLAIAWSVLSVLLLCAAAVVIERISGRRRK